MCSGFQIHVEDGAYQHGEFRPWRLIAGAFKCIRRLRGEYPLWRDFPYEYERTRLAIDLINGSELLREWVDDPAATPADLDRIAPRDEARLGRSSAPTSCCIADSPIYGKDAGAAAQVHPTLLSFESCTDVSIGRSILRTTSASVCS